ncbi:MAG: (4Fe-4S)-binding protein [Desulfuromonas sp.]|nr:MAG: (4Fe-4S)-binding protein [Desulfuromonas sp.]
MKPQVSLHPLNDYAPDRVSEALQRLLSPLGGIGAFVKPGQKVLIKPNMLIGKDPAKAVTTHPELVRQTILLAQAAGGAVAVGDSPGLGKPQDVARKCGIWRVIEETGARFAPFAESVPIHLQNGTFHQLEIAQDALDTDLIINLPKLKTHQMMGFTGAVKNLFGLVVGKRKVQLHLQAGTDKAFFALMLLELAERFAPALSIMDAVVAMEGDGPGSGDPVPVGALLASANPLALDTLATALVGLEAESVWTQRVARETGRIGAQLEQLELFGSDWRTLQPEQFRPAKNTDVNFGLPAPLKNLLKNSLSAKPFINQHCECCGACVRHCPPEAMAIDRSGVKIDYGRCIRCFCCQELCPFSAIETRQGALLRLADMLKGK